MSTRCTAICKDGSQCQGWAERGSDPPRCGVHGPHHRSRPPADRRCTVLCQDGTRCRNWAEVGSDPPCCGPHGPNHRPRASADRLCSAHCEDGSPCQGWAVPGTDPPRCGPHGGGSKPPGPPEGNQNALKHGFFAKPDLPPNPSIDEAIQELFQRYRGLGAYVDQLFEPGPPSPHEVIHLFCIHGRAASKLRKLLHARRDLLEQRAEADMRAALDQALDELSEELGAEL